MVGRRDGDDSLPLGRAAFFAALLLFVALRVVFLAAREPFYDELFTRWLAPLPVARIIEVLRHDSGPPLFYFLTRLAFAGKSVSVFALRFVAVFASLLVLIALRVANVPRRITLIALLLAAVYPPFLYFSTEARSYALCAGLIAVGAAALIRDRTYAERRYVVIALLALVAAAYSHYYGLFAFALPPLLALVHERRALLRGVLLSGAAAIFYIPGFALLRAQPGESIGWMKSAQPAELLQSLFANIPFAGRYSLFLPTSPLPIFLFALSTLLVAIALAVRVREARPWLTVTAVLIAAVVGATLVGRPVYFPLRFESIVAVPLLIALAYGIAELSPLLRRALVVALIVPAALVGFVATRAFLLTPPDAYHDVAAVVRQTVPSNASIVASGYSYLELLSVRDGQWSPSLRSLPEAQATHPGWVEQADASRLRREAAAIPQKRFLWVGDWSSAERQALSERFVLRPLYRNGPIVAAMADSEHRVQPLQHE